MKISTIRARIRGVLAMVALAALVLGSPAALVAWGHFDATTVLRPAAWLTPDDGSIFLTAVTVIGWVAWTVFCVCVVAEVVGMITSQRHHVKLPGLGAIQGIAAGLLVASLTVLSPLTRSAVPPAPVPVVAAAVAAPQPVPEVEEGSENDTERDRGVATVTVEPNDDLWTLAETWYGDGTSWRRIAAANPDVDVDHLVAGQKLALPGVVMTVPSGHTGAGRPISAEELNGIGAQPEKARTRTVTVKPGDTLSGIAQSQLGDASCWPVIWHLNEQTISDPDHIEPGWKLVLPDTSVAETAVPIPATNERAETPAVTLPPENAELLPKAGDEPTVTATDTAAEPQSRADEVVTRADVGQDPAEILRTALAGLSLFLAGGVAGTVTARRQQQLFTRPLGRRIPEVSGDPRRARRVLDAAADQIDAAGSPDVAAYDEVMTPTTVVLGTRGLQTPVLVDLADVDGVLTVNGAPDLATAMVASISLSLVAAPWSGGIDIVAVGEELAWLARTGSDDVQLADEDEVVEGLIGLPDSATRSPITRVVLSCRPLDLPSPVSLAAAGIVVVMAGSGGREITIADCDDAQFDGQPFTPQIVTAPMRRAVVDLLETTARCDTEAAPWWQPRRGGVEGSDPPPAMTCAALPPSDAHVTVEEETVLTSSMTSDVAQLPVAGGHVPSPVLRLLGPVDLLGARGNPPTKARRQCLEYCAWLLCHPGARSVQMADALMVAEPTRRSNVSRLRRWLGTDDAGHAYLPEGYDGSLRLADAVTSDWERLELLVSGGISAAPLANLVSALDLVRGAPLADAAPGQWHWAEEWRIDMIQMVRDIGVEVARRAMETRDIELASRALARATVACPEDEVLLVARIKLADKLGDRGEVERLVYVLSRQARRLGVDLSEETITVLQEVMEGHARARVV
ncbi:LysM peptidoglycan-binding domain-containing protein [Cutibacterium sp. WCA-380-WT-3A]|uniref:LysM peptidoglycan-binding domain-containing protein n=1 Tax=Cutibacterium porci TaxID=2605781 RepID=A0A7K0J459_9ACTN|nr:LysM peptidoglycan-binding domain-containing protein [Cutibacterium porci]MSS44717.1 LysM peptidoglycan-binding domain-containing protein [Cutibacterium porci]